MSSYQQHDPTLLHRWNDDQKLEFRGESVFYIVVLFSIVLVVALLFVYARWICRVGPPAATTELSADPPAPVGLDTATINRLPIVLHRSSPAYGGDGGCCICLGIFGEGDKLKMLPQCGHSCFHSECVEKWLATQSSCPLCRASIRVDSPA